MSKAILTSLAVGLLATAGVPHAGGTVLIFKDADGNGLQNDSPVPSVYGDNVAAGISGSFSYGREGGSTPNIVVDYTDGNTLYTYTGGYGDLSTALYSNPDYTVTFTAEPGFLVRIDSFKIAGFGSDHVLPSVTISNGEAPAPIEYTQNNLLAPGVGHTLVDFSGNLAAALGQTVTLTIRTGDNFNIGVSEIQFSQVPEPSAALMAASGVAFLGMARRRRS